METIKQKSNRWLLISLLMGGLFLVTEITYSWLTVNHGWSNIFHLGNTKTTIEESFWPPESWQPGDFTKKEVLLVNRGSTDAIIRVTLEEWLMLLELDTGTGKLLLEGLSSGEQPVERSDYDTWIVGGHVISSYLDTHGTYQYRMDMYNCIKSIEQAVISYPFSTRGSESCKYIGIIEGASLGLDLQGGGYPDWIYDPNTEAFYYTRVLKPGESTSALLKEVKLNEKVDNRYKGAEYKIRIHSESVYPDISYLSAADGWNLTDGTPVMDALTAAIQN